MKVIWNLTRICSWNCMICCVSAIHVTKSQSDEITKKLECSGEELSLEDKIKVIDDLFDNSIGSIDFSGGDLILNEANIKLIQYAATKFPKECLSVSIPGTGLNYKVLGQLKDCISKVEFTLDSLSDQDDGARPIGYVQVAKKAIELCRNENIDVSISTVIKKKNATLKNIGEIYNFSLKNRIKEWEILRFYQVGRALDDYTFSLDDNKFYELVNFIESLNKKGEINISFQHSLENKINGVIQCNALSRSLGILPNGIVTACSWGLGPDGMPLSEKFILGKVPEKKILEIMNSQKANSWKENKVKNNQFICQVDDVLANR